MGYNIFHNKRPKKGEPITWDLIGPGFKLVRKYLSEAEANTECSKRNKFHEKSHR